jgi:hypothetical protein
MWTCPNCITKVDPSFDVCWNCGTTADGVLDPAFVRADVDGPLPIDAPLPLVEAASDTPLVEAYQALDLMEATFIADQLKAAGIPAESDTYDLHDSLGSMNAAPKVWVLETDLPRARAWLEDFESRKAEASRLV